VNTSFLSKAKKDELERERLWKLRDEAGVSKKEGGIWTYGGPNTTVQWCEFDGCGIQIGSIFRGPGATH